MRILLLFIFLTSMASAKRVALVIGVDVYSFLGDGAQLDQAVADATRMKTTLQSLPEKFEVMECLDQDFANWKKVWAEFRKKAVGADCAVVFYAGHGIEYYGENYFLPRDFQMLRELESVGDTKELLERKAFSLRGMTLELAEAGPNLSVVVLDCCRDNPISLPAEGGKTKSLGRSVGLARVESQPAGSLIAYAAGAGGKANDGIYTEVLAKYLRQPDLRVLEAFAKTREEVLLTTRKWNAEDRARGVRPDLCRPVQHTGEYQNLNFTGMRFSFGGMGDGEGMTPPQVKGTDLQKRAQWADFMVKMEGDFAAAQKLDEIEDWKAFLESYGEVSNSYSSRDEKMLAVARERSLKPAIEGKRAGEERDFEIAPGVKMTMCWIPAGSFQMGSESGYDSEKPVHEVTISKGFWLGKYEVTQGQWKAVMGTSVRELRDKANDDLDLYGEEGLPLNGEGEKYPMYYVDWEESVAFAKKLRDVDGSGWRWRLPSEAEWEYACRAGSESRWSFGDEESELGKYAWYGGNNRKGTLEVGEKKGNRWGLHDIHGNVSEWCGDWYKSYTRLGVRDPGGPSIGAGHVYRGGSGFDTAAGCRSARRSGTTGNSNCVGLRMALQSQDPITE